MKARLPAAKQDTPDQAEANAWISDPPSSNLNDDEWRSIADSLDLSIRQLQIVQYIFDGLDEPSIGKRLRLSPHTVHAHLNRLYRKIEVKSRCEVIVRVFLTYLSQTLATEVRTRALAHQPSCALAVRTTRIRDKRLVAAET